MELMNLANLKTYITPSIQRYMSLLWFKVEQIVSWTSWAIQCKVAVYMTTSLFHTELIALFSVLLCLPWRCIVIVIVVLAAWTLGSRLMWWICTQPHAPVEEVTHWLIPTDASLAQPSSSKSLFCSLRSNLYKSQNIVTAGIHVIPGRV